MPKDGSSVDTNSFVLNALRWFGISRLSVSKVEVLEGSMEGKHLVIICTLTVNSQEVPTHVLIDCKATGIAFMDQDFACHHQIPLKELKAKRQVEVIDGRPLKSVDITHVAKIGMMIQYDKEQLPMFVTKLGHYLIVLGILWLRFHDVAVRFAFNMVTFGSRYCTTHCHDAPISGQRVTEEPPEPVHAPDGIIEPQICPKRSFRGNIVMLDGYLFFQTVERGKLMVFKESLYDINIAIEAKDLEDRPLEEIVPGQYHEFLPLFKIVLADRLQPHQPGIDHALCLKEGETPMWGPLYSMSRAELVALEEWLEENMSKGFIRQSSLPFAAPVLFGMKPDGGLWFCIDYQDINSRTIENRYPRPLIRETLNLLQKARVYMKLDVHGAYNI